MAAAAKIFAESTPEPALLPDDKRLRGVTGRVVTLSLLLAAMFGYVVPTVDYRFTNTFLGAAHLPAGAVAVLLAMLLVINPLLKLASRRYGLSRNEMLTVYITCLFSVLVPGRGGDNFFIPNVIGSFYLRDQRKQVARFFDALCQAVGHARDWRRWHLFKKA